MSQLRSQISLEDRFSMLDDHRRRLVHRLALGDDDVELARSRQIDLGAHCGDISEIARTLNVAGVNYQAKRAGVVTLGRQFFKITNSSVPAVAPASHSNGVVHEALAAKVPPPVLMPTAKAATVVQPPKPNGAMPDVPEVARRIKTLLSPKYQKRLRAVVFSERGDGQAVAQSLGIEYKSLHATMAVIYKKLGLGGVEEGRKAFLRRVFAFIDDEEARAHPVPMRPLEGEVLEGPEVLPTAPLPAPTSEEPKIQQPAPLATATPQAHKAPDTVPAKANGYGAGVVIPIPPDTINVDVVSGEFNGKLPSLQLKDKLQARLDAGFKPAFVVLYPSGDDPSIARGHVIFLEREGQK